MNCHRNQRVANWKIHSVNSSLTFKPCLMLYCFDLFSLNLLITQSIKQNFKTDNTFFRQLPKQMYSIQCTDEIQFIFLFTFVYKYCIIKLNLLGVLNCWEACADPLNLMWIIPTQESNVNELFMVICYDDWLPQLSFYKQP